MPADLWQFSLSWPLWLGFGGGYVLGSIPFGLVLAWMGGYGDIRKIGSGNIGATNVLRTGNKPLALATLILDSGKGGIAAYIAYMLFGPDMMVMAGFGAVIGHNFPVWLKFKGGKGVATSIGTMLVLSFPVGLLIIASWLVSAMVFRISSLAALIAFASAPVWGYYTNFLPDMDLSVSALQRMEVGILLFAFVILRHRENIQRLVKGQEPKIGGKKKD